jgi:WD40 repeat protein
MLQQLPLDWDGVLQIWSTPDGELLHTFDEHLGTIASLAFSKENNLLAASSPSSVSLWRISDSALLNLSAFKSYNSAFPQKIAFSPDSKFLAFGPYGGGLHLLGLEQLNPVQVLNDGQTVEAMAFSSDSTILAVSFGIDQTVEFRQVPDGMLLGTLKLSDAGGATTLAYSSNDEFLAIGGYDHVQIWRLSDKTLLHSFRRNGSAIDQIMFAPNGNVFITGQTTAQWRGIDGEQLQLFSIHGRAFSTDTKLVVGIQSNKLNFFSMKDGKLIKTLRLNFFAQDVVFSADGNLMAVAGQDGTISFWGVSQK